MWNVIYVNTEDLFESERQFFYTIKRVRFALILLENQFQPRR